MKMRNKIPTWLRPFLRGESGLAVVELAFATPFLVAMAVGLTDFGMAWTRQMQLANAVRAGTQYATVRKPNNADQVADIETAALATAPDDYSGGATDHGVALYWYCPDTDQNVNEDTVCPDGLNRQTLVRVFIYEDYDMIFNWPGLGGSIQLGDDRVVRLN